MRLCDKHHYENETPFEIPMSWEWIRLSDIAYFGGGKTPSMDEKRYWQNGRNLWVTSKDMKFDRISDSLMKITDDALAIMTQYDPGTLLMVTRSGILRHSLPIALLEKKATVNQDLKTISFYKGDIAEYIFYAIKANEQFILKEYHKDGTTVDSINFEKFANILLPLPPQNEQLRIIKALHDWFGVAESIEIDKEQLQSVIDGTKSKILDLAIHGKLVSQNPDDEPAIELLKRINPKFTPCDNAHYENVPFEIPKSWRWTCMAEVNEYNSASVDPSKSPDIDFELYSVPAYETGMPEFVKGKDISSSKKVVTRNDVLLCKINPHLNRAWIVSHYKENIPCLASSEWIIFRNSAICPQYLSFCFTSNYFKELMLSNVSGVGGSLMRAQPAIVNKYLFPMPPIDEQCRIVAAIQEYYEILDSIIANL